MTPNLKPLAPKERFVADKAVKADERNPNSIWSDITSMPLYQRAVETALCEMVLRNNAGTAIDAANIGMKLEGAKQLISILTNLGEPDRSPVRGHNTEQLIAT